MMRPSQLVARRRTRLAGSASLFAIAALSALPVVPTLAGEYRSPAAWTPARVTDFAVQDEDNFPWFQLWIPEIGANNATAKARGVVIPAGYQASLTEAYWWVRSAPKVAGVSILDANCDPEPIFENAEVVISRCPTKTVVWEPPMRMVRDQPKTCFLRLKSIGPASQADYANGGNGMFMAFDVATQSIKVGVVVDNRPIDTCSRYLSLKS